MSEEKLRALLAEVKVRLWRDAEDDRLVARIDAALAEPVAEYAPNYASEARSLRARLNDAERERDEARAEVVRAYQRGAEAMREAAARECESAPSTAHRDDLAEAIRALPVPEDK